MREETALLERESSTAAEAASVTEEIIIDENPVEEIVINEDPVEEIVTGEETVAEIAAEEVSQEEMSVAEFLAAETAVVKPPAEGLAMEEADPELPVPGDTSTEEAPVDTALEESTAEEVLEEDEEPPAPMPKVLPYHQRYYLRYREGKRSTALDLSGTKSFLQDIGFDGGELRQARIGRKSSDNFRNDSLSLGSQIRCSYCGAEIGGVEFFRLPDGRIRCTTCSNSVVKTKAEVEALCKRVIANMGTFFGATFDVPISIEVMDELRLKKKIGLPLGTRDSQSMLILGVAINKKDKYSVILENGAPRISLIATFAHELTHIWQYTHWDNIQGFRQCPASKRLLVYEGMAKWVEIQYLYLIGETNVAKREEFITRNRRDAYGEGFCLYEERYPLSREAMNCADAPFTPGCYPFD